MEKVTSTKQLERGQSVIKIERGADVRVDYYKFISEDLANSPDLKERYGYFADFADQPRRFYLSERGGADLYANYTDEDIILMRKAVLEKSLKKVEESLRMLAEIKEQNPEEQ